VARTGFAAQQQEVDCVSEEKKPQVAALLIHGLGGTEYDLGALGKML
jgi:predicted esterase